VSSLLYPEWTVDCIL